MKSTAGDGPGGIVNAAMGVFGRLGYSATRVEDILQAADVARRTFYKQFDSKDAVLAAIYQYATAQLLAAIGAATPANPMDGIVRATDVYLDFHLDNAPLLSVLSQQAVRSDSPLAPLRRVFRNNLYGMLDAAVFAATGKHHDRLLYVALVSALEGMSIELLSKTPTPDQVEDAKAVLHLLIEKTLM